MPNKSASRPGPLPAIVAAVAALATLTLGAGATAQDAPARAVASSEEGAGHFAAPDPADLSPEQASAIYRDIFEQMVDGYRLSGRVAALNYPRWRRFNTSPYRSATHGQRFVNNYANAAAEFYGRFERAGIMPPGAVIVKDTFYVSRAGGVFPGALMIMEKMPPGFSEATGDWRFTMIMPDGSLFGETGGENFESVAFCGNCHALAAENDYLFFLPKEFRVVAE